MPEFFAATWKRLVAVWYAIRRPLDPIVEPLARPVQRWDDRRLARRLRADAAVIAPLRPEVAAQMLVRAAELDNA